MPVADFTHLNVRTPNFEASVRFLTDVLGMGVSPVPGLASMDQAVWILDESGVALLHPADAEVRYAQDEVLPDVPPRGGGATHHVALTCTDVAAMRARLEACEVDFAGQAEGRGGEHPRPRW